MKRILLLTLLGLAARQTAWSDEAAAFFDDREIREIRISFDDPNWYNTLFQSHNSNPDDPYFPCRFESSGVALPRIGCRFKGNSSFRRNGIKKPFKLDFNEYDDNANFFGLKKLNLNNFDLAPDFMREKLLHDFAGKYVAALRSVYVRLYINNAFYGLYLAVEQPDKTMMQSRYGEDEDGNLYEAEEQGGGGGGGRPNLTWLGSTPSLYWSIYLLKTNESANNYSGLIQFLDILNNTPTAELPARLEPVCDVENWLRGMAINNLVVNLDSYVGVGAEYYLYQRTGDKRFVHIQWDHNESFGITGDGTPRLPNPFTVDPFWLPAGAAAATGANARPLLTKLWAVDEYKRLYLRILARFLREGFDPDTMSARIEQLANLIRTDVNADPNKAYSSAQFEAALNSQVTSGGLAIYGLNQFVRERHTYLRGALNALADVRDVRLNELVTVNAGGYRDQAGDSDPWVELHNLGPGPVSLSGLHLSDDPANPTKWQLPARTLADGEFLVVWLDGETSEGETHAGFRPQAAGGTLLLHSSATGQTLDTVAYPALNGGQAYSRVGSYGKTWALSSRTTAGADNAASGDAAAPEPPQAGTGQLLINEVMADNDRGLEDPDEPGAYEDWFEIFNPGAADVDMSGMYLTDNLSSPAKWRVPAGVVAPARGYVVFLADNETAQGPRHAAFALSADGEALALYAADGTTLIDSVVFRTQQTEVSYGRTTDGAATWSIFRPATPGAANARPYANWIAHGASFLAAPLAPGAIASAFLDALSSGVASAASASLPETLGGVTVTVTDSAGATRNAGLFVVTPGQVNFLVPEGTAAGRASVAVRRAGGSVVTGDLLVDPVAPGLLSANADGRGVGLIAAVRAGAGGAQTQIPVYAYDAAQQRVVAVPVSLGAATDQVHLTLYGTGIRGVTSAAGVTVEVGGQTVPVTFAGKQSEFPGLDQVNIGPLPRTLAGRGEVNILMTVSGRRANAVTIAIE